MSKCWEETAKRFTPTTAKTAKNLPAKNIPPQSSISMPKNPKLSTFLLAIAAQAAQMEAFRMKTFYTLKKFGWNAYAGEYSNIERLLSPLTLKQVIARVNRLPDATRWLWSIEEHAQHSNGTTSLLGSVSAEEFDGEVPRF